MASRKRTATCTSTLTKLTVKQRKQLGNNLHVHVAHVDFEDVASEAINKVEISPLCSL